METAHFDLAEIFWGQLDLRRAEGGRLRSRPEGDHLGPAMVIKDEAGAAIS